MALVRCSVTTLCSCLLLGFSGAANAALIDRGAGLIYDSDRDLTWLANTNLGAGSSQDDGFSTTDGLMTWSSAVAWAANLTYYDSVRDVTWDDWRLPTTVQPDAGCSQQEGGGAFAAGTGCTASELGHMFYDELGGTALASILTSSDPGSRPVHKFCQQWLLVGDLVRLDLRVGRQLRIRRPGRGQQDARLLRLGRSRR